MGVNLAAAQADLETLTLRKVWLRLMPLLFLGYIIAYLDRVNVSFAALTANRDLGLSPSAYGLGAGLFYVSYFLCEFHSNRFLERIGARRWIARIMISWGILAAGMAFVVGPWSFYAMRILIGAAEAGFFPGVLLYMTYWFPRRVRARCIAQFMIGSPLSSVIGSPLSGALLGLDGVLGLRGWQWLYIVEAAPALVLGVVVLFRLTDRPAQASWLEPEQRRWLQDTLAREAAAPRPEKGFFAAMADPRVLFYALIFFDVTAPSYGLSLWLPQIVKAFGGLSNFATGLISAIPFLAGTVAMLLWGRQSDRAGERVVHAAACSFLAAAGLAACILTASPVLRMVFITIATAGIFGIKGPFLSLITEGFPGASAAGGIAMVSALGNLSGFVPPYAVGWIRQQTGSFSYGLLFLAVLALLGAVQLLLVKPFERRAARERP